MELGYPVVHPWCLRFSFHSSLFMVCSIDEDLLLTAGCFLHGNVEFDVKSKAYRTSLYFELYMLWPIESFGLSFRECRRKILYKSSNTMAKTTSAGKSGIPAPTAQATSNAISNAWKSYQRTSSHRTKLTDVFLLFLMAVGAIQFFYCAFISSYVKHCSIKF